LFVSRDDDQLIATSAAIDNATVRLLHCPCCRCCVVMMMMMMMMMMTTTTMIYFLSLCFVSGFHGDIFSRQLL
jgi:hypothetical protein